MTLQKFRTWWEYFANLGVDEDLPPEEIVRVRFLNQMCTASLIISLIINVPMQLIYPLSNLVSGMLAMIYLTITLFLNFKGYFSFARHFYIWVTYVSNVFWVIMLGADTQIEMILFTIPPLTVFFFRNWNIVAIYGVFACMFFVLCEYLQTIFVESMVRTSDIILTNSIVFFIATFFTVLAMRYFRKGMTKAQDKSEKLMEKLQTKNEDLNLFATTASHDMKEPIRMISSFSSLLERKYKKELEGDGMEYLAFIQGATSRMETLLNDLLSYSKAGIESHAPEKVDLNQIVQKVKDNLHLKMEESNAIIESEHLPTVLLHPTAIYQVFQNLISNGLKYQPVLIDADANYPHQARIRIEVKEQKENYLFSIQDNGIGIPESKLPTIFDIFNRAHTQQEYEGTGVGLAICKKIIENYGGKIWVDSVEGEGTTFFFTLPH